MGAWFNGGLPDHLEKHVAVNHEHLVYWSVVGPLQFSHNPIDEGDLPYPRL